MNYILIWYFQKWYEINEILNVFLKFLITKQLWFSDISKLRNIINKFTKPAQWNKVQYALWKPLFNGRASPIVDLFTLAIYWRIDLAANKRSCGKKTLRYFLFPRIPAADNNAISCIPFVHSAEQYENDLKRPLLRNE